MSKKKSSWKHKLAAVLVSCFMILVVLLLAEAYCRLFTRINFLDNSRDLFTAGRYGRSYGNTPDFEGISFGEKFFTDADGFRIDPQFHSSAESGAPGILIVSDSVGFGPAVKDDATFAGYLRRAIPQENIYNSSAIGYDTFDYKNVAEAVIAKKTAIKTVVLFYCLNDLNDLSAQQIKQGAPATAQAPSGENGDRSWLRSVNDFLRSRSKLYIWLKNVMQDTQMIYFRNDLAFYQKDENVEYGLQPIADLKKDLDAAGIKFKVFLLPYEAQVRPSTPEEFLLPQKKVGDYLRSHNIDCYDASADFKKSSSPRQLFLFGDPMHLSPEGHKLTAQIVCGHLEENCAIQ
jgi:hypothetical protein